MDRIGLVDSIYEAVVNIDAGRKGFAIRGKEQEGRISELNSVLNYEPEKKLSEKDLLRLYCLENNGISFTEVSVGNRIIAKNSTNRRIDIVRIENDVSKCQLKYGKHKEDFMNMIKERYKFELVESKIKLNRLVIGQILVGEYLFKKKFKVKNVSLAVLYHIGDELLEMFCKDKGIRLIQY